MVPRITCQTLLILTGRAGGVEENLFIFSDDMLVAVGRGCEERVSDISQGLWILKIGYGLCASPQQGSHLPIPCRGPAMGAGAAVPSEHRCSAEGGLRACCGSQPGEAL